MILNFLCNLCSCQMKNTQKDEDEFGFQYFLASIFQQNILNFRFKHRRLKRFNELKFYRESELE